MREEVRSRMASGTNTKKSRHQMPGKGRKKEKSGGAVGLRRFGISGRGYWIQRIICLGSEILS